MNQPIQETPQLTVLYDGACPLCRREIGIYRGLRPLQPDSTVCFADVSDASLALPPDTTREQLLARFHVRSQDGRLLSGAQAFLALWAALPGWRWLALAGPGRPPAGYGLGHGAELPAVLALASDAATLGVPPGATGRRPSQTQRRDTSVTIGMPSCQPGHWPDLMLCRVGLLR